MERRINENYINNYDRVVLTQPLAHNTKLQQIYTKNKDGKWTLLYMTNSVFHVCPFTGAFIKCNECKYFNADKDNLCCDGLTQIISTGALCSRITDCIKAGLQIEFINIGDDDGLLL